MLRKLLAIIPLFASVALTAVADEADVADLVELPGIETPVENDGPLTIMGRPEISIDRMYLFVKQRNPYFLYDIAEAFYVIGERYGIRGDIALCQAVLETGWFRFMDGTKVTPQQYNYGGLGVTTRGEVGNSFATLEEGVTALMQHLYAYACEEALPEGEVLVDSRFKLVKRGSAPTWHELSGRWAMNDHYGADILRIYGSLETFELPDIPENDETLPL